MTDATPSTSSSTRPRSILARFESLWIGPGFAVLAVIMFFGSQYFKTPSAPAPMIDKSALTRGAFRKGADQPMANIGGFMQRCNDCHQLFTSEMDQTRPLAQHGHIHLEHGINNNCANCHAREDREKLILRGGVEIAFSETPRLCQQCHGPVYADWLRGTHGKTMGSWQTGSPDQVRLRCTECHDPHAPAYKPMAPLPSPNTLRMGWQGPIVEHGAERNPLRRWLAPEVHETGAPAQHGTHKGDPETPAGRQEGEH